MKWHTIVLFFVIIPATILEVVLLWWYIYPYKPLEIIEPPTVIQKQVKVGEALQYRIKFKKNTDKPGTITRTLVDGVMYTMPSLTPPNKEGTYDQVITSLVIPHAIPPGTYYFISKSCYQMNPLRTVCVEFQSDRFEVIK